MKNNWLKRLVRWAGDCPDECGSEELTKLANQLMPDPEKPPDPSNPSIDERAALVVDILTNYGRVILDIVREDNLDYECQCYDYSLPGHTHRRAYHSAEECPNAPRKQTTIYVPLISEQGATQLRAIILGELYMKSRLEAINVSYKQLTSGTWLPVLKNLPQPEINLMHRTYKWIVEIEILDI
jgi:hypothetical protein